jgi:hypothetical protein
LKLKTFAPTSRFIHSVDTFTDATISRGRSTGKNNGAIWRAAKRIGRILNPRVREAGNVIPDTSGRGVTALNQVVKNYSGQ